MSFVSWYGDNLTPHPLSKILSKELTTTPVFLTSCPSYAFYRAELLTAGCCETYVLLKHISCLE